jgi:1,2-diacylglycerol-3-alpha-glucose alpha-1,2-glucosyltransferase
MKVCLYGELGSVLKGSGIGSAIDQQEKALRLNGVEVTRNPSDEYDLLDINTIGPRSAYYAHKMRWNGVPLVIHTHTTVEDLKDSFKFSTKLAPKMRSYLRYFYAQADLVISPTEYTRNVIRSYGVHRITRVISNGVDTDAFRFDARLREEYRKLYGLEGQVPYSVGHIFKRKGVLDFLQLARNFPDVKFMWAGRNYKDLVGADIKRAVKNKPENVTFTGYVKDIAGAYCAGDIFIFPSWCENQGISILEAAACKRPLIVRDLPTYDGWLQDGVNCLIAKDNAEFADHIRRLLEDKRLRNKLANGAYHMSREHTLKKIGAQLKQAYETLM